VQLMPATAVSVAERIGRSEPTAEDLFDPSVNLELGAAELGRLVEVFGGRRAPAIAAYNAGEAQAKLWLDQCGQGCTDALYLLNISFRATRAYTAGVMAAATNYAELYALDGENVPSMDQKAISRQVLAVSSSQGASKRAHRTVAGLNLCGFGP